MKSVLGLKIARQQQPGNEDEFHHVAQLLFDESWTVEEVLRIVEKYIAPVLPREVIQRPPEPLGQFQPIQPTVEETITTFDFGRESDDGDIIREMDLSDEEDEEKMIVLDEEGVAVERPAPRNLWGSTIRDAMKEVSTDEPSTSELLRAFKVRFNGSFDKPWGVFQLNAVNRERFGTFNGQKLYGNDIALLMALYRNRGQAVDRHDAKVREYFDAHWRSELSENTSLNKLFDRLTDAGFTQPGKGWAMHLSSLGWDVAEWLAKNLQMEVV